MSLRDRLRAIPPFPAELPGFEPDAGASTPEAQFLGWLDEAIGAGQPAPHVMTLSTADAEGRVGARNLILKDIDERGWQFASHATSPKARELAENPRVALSFWWPVLGRQIRVVGTATALPAEESGRDFLARPTASRAAALVGHQSETMADRDDFAQALQDANERLDASAELTDPAWTVYAVAPDSVEFWQARHDRAHTRLRYERQRGADVQAVWTTTLLWP